jgi:hypothetical protein
MSWTPQRPTRERDEQRTGSPARGAGDNGGLYDVVLFDVRRAALTVYDRLRSDHETWVQFRNVDQFVAVAVGEDPEELASLLGTVRAVLQGCGYARMRFELDGRSYSLRLHRVVEPTLTP